MGKYNRSFPTSYTGNPYYNPEACGLELLGIAEKEPEWDFYILGLWRDKETGELFLAQDSGCSCPTPFEEFTSLDKLTRIKKIEDFDKFVDNHVDIDSSDRSYSYGIKTSDIRALRTKASRIFAARKRQLAKEV